MKTKCEHQHPVVFNQMKKSLRDAPPALLVSKWQLKEAFLVVRTLRHASLLQMTL